MKKFVVAYHINSGTKGMYFVNVNDKNDLTKEVLDDFTRKEVDPNVPSVVIDKSTDYMIEEIGENMKSPYTIK